jgi:hypothetical protein
MMLDYAYGGYPTDDYQVPIWGTKDYYDETQNKAFYLDSSDSIGLVPNYSGSSSADSYSSGGYNVGGLMSSAGSSMGGTAGAYGNALGAISNAYNGASTSTTGSVLSGAASGAQAGAAFGPWGMAIGAVIGGIAGFFGSKAKKKAAKKAFQMELQKEIAPYQQQQANYLQNQGLEQQAISNYRSAFTPGGYQYTNALTGGPKNNNFGIPTQAPTLPNFNVAPPSVVPGTGDPSLGIAGNNVPSNSVNLNPGAIQTPGNTSAITPATSYNQASAGTNPYYGFNAPTPLAAPTAPKYTGKKNTDAASISNYQQQYKDYINDQNQQYAANMMNAYSPYFSYQGSGG